MNDKGDLSDHIQMIERKAIIVTAQINKLLMHNSLSDNSSLIAINLVKCLLIPVMCYSLEYRVLRRHEVEKINRIFIRAIKNIWTLKKRTPNWACLSELGLLPLDIIIDARRLAFLTINVPKSEILEAAFKSNNYWTKELMRLHKKFNYDFPLIRENEKEVNLVRANNNEGNLSPLCNKEGSHKDNLKTFLKKAKTRVAIDSFIKQTRNSNTMKKINQLDCQCDCLKSCIRVSQTNVRKHNFSLRSQFMTQGVSSPVNDTLCDWSNSTPEPACTQTRVKSFSNLYELPHCNYTCTLPIRRVRNLILARTSTLLNKGFGNGHQDEDDKTLCPLCESSAFCLEHLMDECKYVNNLFPADGCNFRDLFRCGDAMQWAAREDKLAYISRCLYSAVV